MLKSRFCNNNFDRYKNAYVHYVVYAWHVWLLVEYYQNGQHVVEWYSFSPYIKPKKSPDAWMGLFVRWDRDAYIKHDVCVINEKDNIKNIYLNCKVIEKEDDDKDISDDVLKQIIVAKSWLVTSQFPYDLKNDIDGKINDENSGLSKLRFQYRGGNGNTSFNCATWPLYELKNKLPEEYQRGLSTVSGKLSFFSKYIATHPHNVRDVLKNV